MAKVAAALGDQNAKRRWLRIAGEQGAVSAIDALAREHDPWALRKLAEAGDIDAIRELAEMAVESDPHEAWVWQHLALLLGTDLTESNMRAYHEGGSHHGEKYDDDIGGPLYVAGDEGLALTPLNPEHDREARELALNIFEGMSLDD